MIARLRCLLGVHFFSQWFRTVDETPNGNDYVSNFKQSKVCSRCGLERQRLM